MKSTMRVTESHGVVLYFIPLLVTCTVSACLTKRDRWIEYIQSALLILALLDAAIILYEFKHICADIYTFRCTTLSIGWMPLEALAQLLVLDCILAYARVLYASDWKSRIVYGAALCIYLLVLYFSLENSWWLEAGAGLMVMTIVYSRRLFVCSSAVVDLVASYFFLPPRQRLHVVSLPQALVSWIIYGCVLYKDQMWRLASRRPSVSD